MENRVEELRKKAGMNQDDFAKAIRVSRQTISSIETGKYNPSLELAFTIADFFDTDTKLDGLFFGFAGAGIIPGIMMIFKYCYWSSPKNKERYAEKLENEKIELHDELKEKLRDKSGRYAYTAGLFVIAVSMMLFAVLNSLEIVQTGNIIVLVLGGYLVFQIVIGIVIFNHLMKKY